MHEPKLKLSLDLQLRTLQLSRYGRSKRSPCTESRRKALCTADGYARPARRRCGGGVR